MHELKCSANRSHCWHQNLTQERYISDALTRRCYIATAIVNWHLMLPGCKGQSQT
jgi:hypothetical protein